MRRDLAWLAVLLVGLPSCGGGGGGTTGPNPPPTTTLAPPPTTTLPPAGSPSLKISLSKSAGKQPVDVNFSLCDSRDGAGGQGLRYFADLGDGNGLQPTSGCGFSHRFGSDGVTVYRLNLCVENASGGPARQCAERTVKAYVDVSISVSKNTGCDATVVAAADLKLGHNSADVSASAQVDRVMFEAFNAAGSKIAERDGTKQSNTEWRSGTWNVNDTTKLRVKATVFSNGVRGDDIPEADRPGC